MNNPLLSIIIPTKDRYFTLFNVVDTILSFNKNNDIEIVIQDNSRNNTEALNYLAQRKNYINLKYFYNFGILSVIENCDKAVLNSRGKYVCMIGDDDGVMPYVIEVVEWMNLNDIKVLKAFKPSYFWPGQKPTYLSKDITGILNLEKFNYYIKKISTKEALDFTFLTGGTSMKMLPCLYHGIVKRDVLDSIFNICSTYFPGPSPDMANGVALTKFINEYTYVDFPIVIAGKCIKSAGGQGILHKHVARLEDVSHLPKDTAKFWSKEIPKYWTGPTIYAESVLKAIDRCEINIDKNKFNFSYLYAWIYLFEYKYRKEIFFKFPIKVFIFNFYLNYILVFILRLSSFIKNKFSPSVDKYKKVKNIEEAIKLINNKVDYEKLSFHK